MTRWGREPICVVDECKPLKYGTSLEAVRVVAATGKMVIMGVNVDGCTQLKANPGVDAYFIYVGTSEPAVLRNRLKMRLKEDESTVQKVRPGGHYSTRHNVPFTSSDEGSKCDG